MKNIRVFIAEADQDVRVGLQMLLNRQPGLQVVGIATRSDGLVGQVGAAQPDVVLLDWGLVASNPKDFIRNLHSLSSQPSIIVLHIQPETRDAALAAGADDFSSKESTSRPALYDLPKSNPKKELRYIGGVMSMRR